MTFLEKIKQYFNREAVKLPELPTGDEARLLKLVQAKNEQLEEMKTMVLNLQRDKVRMADTIYRLQQENAVLTEVAGC